MQRVQDAQEEDAGRGDRGGDVAEDVDLGAPRALGAVAQAQRHPARLERGPHRPPHVDRAALAAAPLLVAERRQPALQLGDRAVHRGEVLGRAGRQRAVELGQRARGRQLAGPLDQPALELAAQVGLEAANAVAIELDLLAGPVAALGLRARGQAERPADPLDVDADDAGALAAAAERGDREGGEVAHLRRRSPRRSRGGSPRGARRGRGARRRRARPRWARVPLAGLARLARDRLQLGGAEEPAVEDQLEQPPVVLRLRQRRRQRLAEVLALGPGDDLERGEGVEDLRGPDRDALRAQLLDEGDQLRRDRWPPAAWRSRARSLRAAGGQRARRASSRRARRPGRGRRGA